MKLSTKQSKNWELPAPVEKLSVINGLLGELEISAEVVENQLTITVSAFAPNLIQVPDTEKKKRWVLSDD